MRALIAALCLLAAPAAAQEVSPCDWQARADAIAEPWEENSRTFANGATRLALLDVIEPAAMPFHLLVLSPPYDPVGGRSCKVVSWDRNLGFYNIAFAALNASYDPAVGLIFDVPVEIWLGDRNIIARNLRVTVNQATGDVRATLP